MLFTLLSNQNNKTTPCLLQEIITVRTDHNTCLIFTVYWEKDVVPLLSGIHL